MKILFLVHVEEMFRKFFPDKMYALRLRAALGRYDRVIVIDSEVDDPSVIEELETSPYGFERWFWGWGYEKDGDYGDLDHEKDESDEDGHSKWIIPANGHEWTWVHYKIRDPEEWNQHEILVGGGCRYECMQDWLDVLDHVGINYRVVDGYVYG